MNKNETTLGKRLKIIAENSKVNLEIEKLTNKLVELAEQGNTAVRFNDLREYTPLMIATGALWDWLTNNDLSYSG